MRNCFSFAGIRLLLSIGRYTALGIGISIGKEKMVLNISNVNTGFLKTERKDFVLEGQLSSKHNFFLNCFIVMCCSPVKSLGL